MMEGARRQAAMTYLLHFVERRLVHAELLEIILRSLDDLLDNLLVDITLMLLSAHCLSPCASARLSSHRG